jgi:hypothetical protein
LDYSVNPKCPKRVFLLLRNVSLHLFSQNHKPAVIGLADM